MSLNKNINDNVRSKITIIDEEFEKIKNISSSLYFNLLKVEDKKNFNLLTIELGKIKFIYNELSNKTDNDILTLLTEKELLDIDNVFDTLIALLKEFNLIKEDSLSPKKVEQ